MLQPFIEGNQGGSSRQTLKQRPRKDATYWLPSHGLITGLSCTAQAHLPRDGNAHSGLGPPMSVNNQATASQAVPTGMKE